MKSQKHSFFIPDSLKIVFRILHTKSMIKNVFNQQLKYLTVLCIKIVKITAIIILFFISLKIFYYSLHLVLFCINFKCTAQWLDNSKLYKMFPLMFSVTNWHHT